MAYRSLTDGEIVLAKTVFKDSIDYSRIRLYDSRVFPKFLQAQNRAMADLNKVSFPGTSYSEDFAKETDVVRQSIFIHELAHVWQHQNKIMNTRKASVQEMLRHKFKYASAYTYKLDPAKDLTRYRLEQQATIVQDYFLLKHCNSTHSHRNSRRNTETGAELMDIYESVLGRFIANPNYAKRKPGGRKPKL